MMWYFSRSSVDGRAMARILSVTLRWEEGAGEMHKTWNVPVLRTREQVTKSLLFL